MVNDLSGEGVNNGTLSGGPHLDGRRAHTGKALSFNGTIVRA
jgi:hypothetical protein